MIPFIDLSRQYLSIKEKIDNVWKNAISDNNFIGGRSIVKFEKEFAHFINGKYAIGCANGTDSLEMILKSLNIGVGDEVLVPALSWISTSECVSSLGATPIFVDIDSDYYTINPDLLETKISSRTRAIIPVHIYGQPCDMVKIMAFAKKHNLNVIEDCAQAHNAEFKGKKTGNFGIASSFSFYPGKNLGAYGDAGAVVTNNNKLARTIKMLSNHGQLEKHKHLIEGRNSRMDSIQAEVLSIKLPYLNDWTNKRIENARYYTEQLSGIKQLICPKVRSKSKHVFHLYVIQAEKRDELMKYLNKHGIQTAIHYPSPLPFLDCYKKNPSAKSEYNCSKSIQNKILSLPMFPELTKEEIRFVSNKIKDFFDDKNKDTTS